MANEQNIYFQKPKVRIITLLLLLVIGGSLSMMLSGAFALQFPNDSKTVLICTSIVQNIFMFALPALCSPFFFCNKPMSFLGIKTAPTFKPLIGILLVMFIAMPALNQIIYWNEQMTLPHVFGEFEQCIRNYEQKALETTSILLKGNSILSLLISLSVVGVLTGICEELFFRGALQRILESNGINCHFAIWISAIIFSLMHLQMYGFMPRVLLGAFFGYILLWTRSVWVSASAHALNNSIVVITVWLQNNNIVSTDINPESIGVTYHGIPYIALISALLTVGIFIKLRLYFFKQNY